MSPTFLAHLWRTFVVAVVAASFVSCASAPPTPASPAPLQLSTLPTLGSPFATEPVSSSFTMTAAATLAPSRLVSVEGVTFTIGVSSTRLVTYISTDDPRFRTPEGIRVGASLAEVTASGAAFPIPELGWGFHTRLPSGWQAAFVNGEGLSEAPLPPSATVRWLFLRQ